MPETDTSAKNPLHVSEVDDNLKELSPHGSFELPVETYMANCEIFHALYDLSLIHISEPTRHRP